jgi:small subunit ribosomal protein S8
MNQEKNGKSTCVVKPISTMIKKVFEIFEKEGYLGSFKVHEDSKGDWLTVNLLGSINKAGVVKPRFSVTRNNFEKYEKRYLPARNIGFMIVSTSQGIMTHHEAKEKNIGGRLIAYCY